MVQSKRCVLLAYAFSPLLTFLEFENFMWRSWIALANSIGENVAALLNFSRCERHHHQQWQHNLKQCRSKREKNCIQSGPKMKMSMLRHWNVANIFSRMGICGKNWMRAFMCVCVCRQTGRIRENIFISVNNVENVL